MTVKVSARKILTAGALVGYLVGPVTVFAQSDADELQQLLNDPAGYLALVDPRAENLADLIAQAALSATPDQLGALVSAAESGGLTSEQAGIVAEGLSQAVAGAQQVGNDALAEAITTAAFRSGNETIVSAVAQQASPTTLTSAIESAVSSNLSTEQESALANGMSQAVATAEQAGNDALAEAVTTAAFRSGNETIVSIVAQQASPTTVSSAIDNAGTSNLSTEQVNALAVGLADASNNLPPDSPLQTAISESVETNTSISGLSDSYSEAAGTMTTSPEPGDTTTPPGATDGTDSAVEQQFALTQETTAPPAQETPSIGGDGSTSGSTTGSASGTSDNTSSGSGGNTSTPIGSTGGGGTAGGTDDQPQSPTN
jgi:hypothetical protein